MRKLLAAKKAGKAAGTLHMYKVKAGHVLRVFGEHARMRDIGPESVDGYITTRQGEGASNNTIGKELTTIVQIAKAAKRAGEYAGDLSVLRPPDFSIDYKPRERVLLPTEERKLRLACSAAQWGAVAFILGTGARLSELLAARPSDIDWARREVRIRGTKTKASAAVIPIVDRAGLAAYLKEAEPHLPVSWPHMSKELPRLCKAAGIPAVTPNDLRRTVSTRLIEAGVDPYDVAKITRHATLMMLKQVYDRAAVGATRNRIDGTKTVQGSVASPRKRAPTIAD